MEEWGLGGVGVWRLRGWSGSVGSGGSGSVEVEGVGAGGSGSMEVKGVGGGSMEVEEGDDKCGLPSTSEEAGTVRKRLRLSAIGAMTDEPV